MPLALTLLAAVGYGLAWYRLSRYAWMLPAGGGPAAGRQLGAELMYYGGTAIDVALAVIVMTQWYLAAGRRPGPDPAAVSRRRTVMPRWRWVRRSLRPNTSAPAHQCPAWG